MINNIKMEQLNIFDYISEAKLKVKPIQIKQKELELKITKQFDINSLKERIKKRDEFLKKYAFLYCVSRSKTQMLQPFVKNQAPREHFTMANGCRCLQVFIIIL